MRAVLWVVCFMHEISIDELKMLTCLIRVKLFVSYIGLTAVDKISEQFRYQIPGQNNVIFSKLLSVNFQHCS